MNHEEDLLQEQLARLEAGQPLERCLADLPENEAGLLQTAAMLRALPHPDRVAGAVAAQRTSLLRAAGQRLAPAALPSQTDSKAAPRWAWPAAAPRPAVILAACGVVVVAIIGALLLRQPPRSGSDIVSNPGLSTNPLPAPTAQRFAQFLPMVRSVLSAPDPHSAVLNDMRGIVEVSTGDGQWTSVKVGQVVAAGQRIRTGQLSGATLQFYDGSQAQLGSETELSVDELNARIDGPRVVRLTQWIGESDHDVVPSNQTASRYEVNTPSGNGVAKGTLFHVSVSAARITRISVEEGSVAATGLNVTVIIIAGQITTIPINAPPAEPVFRVTGEGVVTQIGATWSIGAIEFVTDDETAIVGNPQVGDTVRVEGHLLPDGTRVADVIALLRRAPENRFAFTGTVDSIGDDEWIVTGRAINVTANTDIDAGIEVGDRVEVEGVVQPDGTLAAEHIRRVEEGRPFEFVGVVEAIGGDEWTISGVTVAITDTTEIDAGLAVGDVVKVDGRILDDATWVAGKIKRAEEDRHFEFTGVVQSIDPWGVSGIALETDDQTEIDDAIAVGDRVKVEGRVLDDGTWLAEEIRRLDDIAQRFEFVGRVTSIDPWIIGGVPIAVDSDTAIGGDVEVGARVRVTGRILDDGTLLAEEIKLIHPRPICFDVRARIVGIDGDTITLSNGQTIELTDAIEVHGHLSVGSVVIVRICIDADGSIVVVSIRVIFQPIPPTPLPPQPCPGIRLVVVANGQIALPSGTFVQISPKLWLDVSVKRKGDEAEIRLNGRDPKIKVKVNDKGKHPEIEVKVEGKHKDWIAVVGAGRYALSSGIVVRVCVTPGSLLFTVSGQASSPTPVPPPAPPPIPPPVPPPDTGGEVTLCHIPGGNPAKAHTIQVGPSAVSAHLSHGDTLGPCGAHDDGDRGKGKDTDK